MKRALASAAAAGVSAAPRLRALSTAAAAVTQGITHSDLSYRALLRNLRVLKGLRGDKTQFNVVITGVDAVHVAAAMRRLEPALNFEIAGDSQSADLGYLAGKRDEEVDSVIVCQPYHTLHSAKELAGVRRALHDEDGTIGLIWHRATGVEAWVRAFDAAASAPRPELAPPLAAVQLAPLQWVSDLAAPAHGFKPVKHRKFVETLRAPALDALLPVLRAVSDARVAPGAAGDASFAAGAAAARALVGADGGGVGAGAPAGELLSLSLDLHAFHTSVVPRKAKKQ